MLVRFVLMLTLFMAPMASANMPSEVAKAMPNAAPLGSATTRVLGFALYEAELFTPNGSAFSMAQPFALTLTYKRTFRGGKLAEATVDEIARIEGIDASALDGLFAEFEACFRDVAPGDRVMGYGPSADGVDIYVRGARTCQINDSGIRQRFFNIWLSDASRDPDGARQLRGQG